MPKPQNGDIYAREFENVYIFAKDEFLTIIDPNEIRQPKGIRYVVINDWFRGQYEIYFPSFFKCEARGQ